MPRLAKRGTKWFSSQKLPPKMPVFTSTTPSDSATTGSGICPARMPCFDIGRGAHTLVNCPTIAVNRKQHA